MIRRAQVVNGVHQHRYCFRVGMLRDAVTKIEDVASAATEFAQYRCNFRADALA